jgi:hypothetical protein
LLGSCDCQAAQYAGIAGIDLSLSAMPAMQTA